MEIHWEWFPPSNLILKGLLLKIPPFFPDNPREFVSLNRELQHLNSPFVRIHFLFRSKASQKHSMIKLKITEPPQCHGKLVTTNIYWNTLSLHISSPRFNRKALTNSLTSTARIKRKGFSNATHPRPVHIWWEWPDGERLPEFLRSDIRGSGR